MATAPLSIRPIDSKADRKRFVDLPFRLYKDDPNWVPPLKGEALGAHHAGKERLVQPRTRATVSRPSAAARWSGASPRISTRSALTMDPVKGFGPGCGQFGLLDAEDGNTAQALITAAEGWLRGQGMDRVLGRSACRSGRSRVCWSRDSTTPPTIMMGHAKPEYRGWIEAAGYHKVKELVTYELDITKPFPPLLQRIIASGEKNPRIVIREVDKTRFEEEAAIILHILNDAWSDNWGFVPLTRPKSRTSASS